MKINKLSFGFITLILAGSAVAVVALSPDSPVISRLNIDHTPPIRSGELGGFAPVVEKVSPSIVSIISSRSTQMTSGSIQGSPFGDLFDDPRLAPFFQDRGNRRNLQPSPAPAPRPRAYGQGSGVVLTEDGYVLTNNHVIDGADEVEVAFDDSGRKYPAEIVGRDPQTDLAVLKIESDDKFPAVTIGDSGLLKPGDTVLAIGNPFGLSKTVTSGIVSAIGRTNLNITDGGYENFIQTDASINPGNSGGALIDNRGNVVGINTAIFSRSGGNVGIGFAIPVNMAVDIADRLISDGSVERAYLGVMLGPLTTELAAALGVEQSGVLVNDVMPDTPAAKAGIENGDVITHFNGKAVNDVSKLRFSVGASRPGDSGEFTVIRDGKEKVINAELGRLPNQEVAHAGDKPLKEKRSTESKFLDGVKIAPLSDSVRSTLGVPESVSDGVVVTEVDPVSEAAEAGLRVGDVITEVARTSVGSVDDAIGAAKKSKGGALLLRVTSADGGSHYLAITVS